MRRKERPRLVAGCDEGAGDEACGEGGEVEGEETGEGDAGEQ